MLSDAVLFLAATLGLGSVQLDGEATLAGAAVSGSEVATLPHGRGIGDLLDVSLVAPISHALSGGGIDLFDSLQLSVHGFSWTQLHHRWGEVDLDDPAAAGQPLLQLPLEVAGQVVLQDGWSAGPTLTLQTPVLAVHGVRAVNQARLHGAWGQVLDGGAWTPARVFDREPAFAAGAPRRRRALTRAREGRATSTVQIGDGSLFLLGERIEHAHRYPLLSGEEAASRDSAVMAFGRTLAGWPSQLRLAYQGSDRPAVGAAWRWPEAALQHGQSRAWTLQLETQRALRNRVRLQLAAGFGGRQERRSPWQGGPTAQDLAGQWTQLARPSLAQNDDSVQASARVRLSWRPQVGRRRPAWWDPRRAVGGEPRVAESGRVWRRDLTGAVELPPIVLPLAAPEAQSSAVGATLSVEVAGKVQGYRRHTVAGLGPFGLTDGTTGLQLSQLEGPRRATVRGAQLRGELGWSYVLRPPPPQARGLGPMAVQAVGGVHLAVLTGPLQQVVQVAPALGLAARTPLGPFGAFLLLRREPETPTSQLGDALGGDAASGTTYAWDDANGDGLPQADEAGARLANFGGLRHARSGHLSTPSHHLLQLGLHLPFMHGWSAGVRGTVHVLQRRYQLVRRGDKGGEVRAFVDPGGDGRGERRGRDGHQRLTVRAELPASPADGGAGLAGAAGGAEVVLANARRASAYYGVELELHSPRSAPFFVALLGAAYISAGEAPFGNAADRNDPGILSEASAGRNDHVHAYGRYDHDRSFALKVQAGVRPVEGLQLSLAGRYRDGQPFTRIVVDRTDALAPQALMATGRGGARYTFRMAWDLRLRYATAALRPFGLTLVADVYNLFNSATEVAEDPTTGGNFRRALEAVPARSGWVGLELAFLP